MSLSVTIKITPDANKLIARLGSDFNRGIRAGMLNAVETVEAEGVEEAPVKTGNLVNTITSYVTDGGMKGIVKAIADYAEPVHEGTRPHVILPKNKKALSWPGAAHPVKKVQHPGTRANPFFKRAIRRGDPQGAFEEGIMNFLRRRGW